MRVERHAGDGAPSVQGPEPLSVEKCVETCSGLNHRLRLFNSVDHALYSRLYTTHYSSILYPVLPGPHNVTYFSYVVTLTIKAYSHVINKNLLNFKQCPNDLKLPSPPLLSYIFVKRKKKCLSLLMKALIPKDHRSLKICSSVLELHLIPRL